MEPFSSDKSGIQIGFDIGNHPQIQKQPLNVWLVGTYSHNDRITKPTEITLNNIDEQLANIVDSISVLIDHPMVAADTSNGYLNIPIRKLADFRPHNIASNIPSLAPYASVLKILLQRKHNKLDDEQLNTKLAQCRKDIVSDYYPRTAPHHETISHTTHTSDALSSLIDFDESNRRGHENFLFENDTRPVNNDQKPIDIAIAALKRDIFSILERLYSAPEFRIIEKNWLALAQILKLQNTKNTRVFLLNSSYDSATQKLEQALALTNTETRPLLAVIAFGFNNSTHSIKILNDFGIAADRYQLPIAISLDNNFFEKSPSELATIDTLGGILQQAKYDAWNALRNKDHAKWLCVGYNDFLVRDSYHADNNRELEFESAQKLWGEPNLVIAALVVKSIAKTGWPTEIGGTRNGLTTQMPLHTFEHPLLGDVLIPLATVIDEERQEAFRQIGVTALQCIPNREQIFVSTSPMLIKYRKYNDRMVNLMNQKTHDLAYQLLGAAIIPCLSSLVKKSFNRKHPSAVKENLEEALHDFILDTGSGAKADVQLMIDPDKPSTMVATITIKTGKKVLNGAEIEFNTEI